MPVTMVTDTYLQKRDYSYNSYKNRKREIIFLYSAKERTNFKESKLCPSA